MTNSNSFSDTYFDRYNEGYNFGILSDKSTNLEHYFTCKKVGLSIDTSKKINSFIRERGIDISVFFKAAFGILLQRYNNVNDVSFFELCDKNKVSLVRVKNDKDTNIESFLIDLQSKETTKKYIEIFELQKKIEDHELPECVTLFSYKEDLKDIDIDNINKHVRFMVFFYIKGEEYFFDINYDTCNYSDEIIDRIATCIVNIINVFATNSKCLVDKVDCISEIEKEKVLLVFNNTYMTVPFDSNIVSLFEARVRNTPDDMAIVSSKESISFKELNYRANQLANRLLKLNISSDDIVPLYCKRSVMMIIAILGVLKAGAAYIPLDSVENVNNIINECNPKVIITYNKEFENKDISIINLVKWELSDESKKNIDIPIEQKSRAICIYTSGSTGKPKGVLINHIGLLNAILTNIKVYELSDKDTVLQFSNYTYAQSIIDIFTSLLRSRLCLLLDEEYKDILAIESICNTYKITVMAMTPSLIKEMCPEKFKYVRILDSTGEVADISVLKKWSRYCTVLNSYGSTELTGNTSVYKVTGEEKHILPIGKPIYNNEYYIYDRNEHICDIGMLGELYISGLGLSEGYLNDSELTSKKFIINKFNGKRMFRTGDMARWLSDGNVEYFGRIDKQIKIRGVRINLNAINTVFDSIYELKNYHVTVNTDSNNDKVICAYLVSDKVLDIDKIRKKLMDKLPAYMVPSYITQLERIPINKNAKVDMAALPKPKYNYSGKLVLAKTDEEKLLISLLCEELNITNISMDSKFIELGGDSIKAIRIISKLRELGYGLTVANLLEESDIELIATRMKKCNQIDDILMEDVSEDDMHLINSFYNLAD